MKNSGIISVIATLLLYVTSYILILVKAQNNTDLTNQTTTLRLVVPVREFNEFVKIIPLNNGKNNFSGFSIDVFNAAANIAIPSIKLDFFPFAKADGTMNGTFDDMLMAVQNKEYDGAVGEITILYYRMQYVDFTMPYLASEIGMLVPTRSIQTVALTPVAKIDLIVAIILAFGILVAVLLWIWKLCNYNRASSSIQPSGRNDNMKGTIIWGKLIIYTRLLIILVLMGLLLIIASYIPHQTSLLPTQTQVVHINMDEAKVGYREGSFERNTLLSEGFSESQLVELNTEADIVDKLQKGSQNGGIDALVAGTHILKLFQEKYCDNFTINPNFLLQSSGIGFAFQKGSPFVNEFTEAIVRLIDNQDISSIQEKTIGSLANVCPDNTETLSNLQDRLSLWLPAATSIFVVGLVILMLLSHCGKMCLKNRHP